jgi:hypothetical protein
MRNVLAIALPVLVVTACGGGDDGGSTELEGIYQLASWTHNPDSCDGEGPDAAEASFYTHFFVKFESFFGEDFVTTVFCDNIDDCRATAAEEDTIHIGNFAFDEGNDDEGWTGKSLFLTVEDTCMGPVYFATLTGDPGASVRIDEETRTVSDIPLDDSGDGCDEEAAYAQAEPLACEELTVVMGSFVEGI